MTRRTGFALAIASLLIGLAAIGYWMLFSNLALYDDEGYVLISARDYFAHGGLYVSVYSQYGPAFYVLADLFQHLSGAPVDHTAARLLTLAFWLGTAGCCAVLVHRQTASRVLTAFTLTAVFLYLYFITDEPFHPGSLIIFLLALTLCVMTALVDRGRLGACAVLAGGMTAILLLTKINVGAFFAVGVVAWAVLAAAPAASRRGVMAAVVVGLALFAGALTHTLWPENWVQIYLALFAIGAVTLVRVVRPLDGLKSKHVALFVAGGAGVALAVLGTVWLRGTPVSGLVDGVFLGPLRHPNNYSYPVDWRPGTLVVAGLSLVLAFAYPSICRRWSVETADRWVIAVRLIQALGLLIALALLMHFRVVGAVFSFVAPLIWTWVIPLHGARNSRATEAGRGLLATILLLQYLHAYPVGGSQESWGTFLFIPLVALGLAEIHAWNPVPASAVRSPRWWPLFAALMLAVCIAKTACVALTSYVGYADREDLRLPGAEKLHLPDAQRTAYQLLVLNAVVHGDQLFSLPGMFSFNLWTDLPTPTRKNTTLWFTLLSDAEQTAIIQSIAASARPCIIVQESLIQMTLASKVPIRGVLVDYIQHHFSVAFRIEGFAFLVRTGRTIAPLGVAKLTTLAVATPASPDSRLDFCLAGPSAPIATIMVSDLSAPREGALKLDSSNSRVTAVAINSGDQAFGEPARIGWPLPLDGLRRVSIEFRRNGFPFSKFTTLVQLKDAAGRIVGEARLNE